MRDYNRAIVYYSRAIEIDPQNAEYHRSRGTTYRTIGNYDQAIKDLREATTLDSYKDKALRDLGEAYYSNPTSFVNMESASHACASGICFTNQIGSLYYRGKALIARRTGESYLFRGLTTEARFNREIAEQDFQRAVECGYGAAKNALEQVNRLLWWLYFR